MTKRRELIALALIFVVSISFISASIGIQIQDYSKLKEISSVEMEKIQVQNEILELKYAMIELGLTDLIENWEDLSDEEIYEALLLLEGTADTNKMNNAIKRMTKLYERLFKLEHLEEKLREDINELWGIISLLDAGGY